MRAHDMLEGFCTMVIPRGNSNAAFYSARFDRVCLYLRPWVVGIPFKRFHRLVLNLLGVYDNIIATYKIIDGSSTVCRCF